MDTQIPTPEQAALIRKTFQLSPASPVPLLHPISGGMTNRSFRFSLEGRHYFLREPGTDSGRFISRSQEATVYRVIRDFKLTDEVLMLEPDTGRKITRFWAGARTCDPKKKEDVEACMALLRRFHAEALQVSHEYDPGWLMKVYAAMMPRASMYPAHKQVYESCQKILPILSRLSPKPILCHCDTSPTNFLFFEEDGIPQLRLIDWEFSGLWDPCGDIAIFATASEYTPAEVNDLMHCYLQEIPSLRFRLRVYGFLALMGMTWSNWAEYLMQQGLDTEGYGPSQFSYAQYYAKLFWALLPQVLEEET